MKSVHDDENRERRRQGRTSGVAAAVATAVVGLGTFGRSRALPGAPRSRERVDADPLPRLLSGVGLVASFVLAALGRQELGSRGAVGALVVSAAMWLMLWSQLAAALLGRARLGWPRRMVPELFALLALVGVGVVAVLFYVASAAGTVPATALALRAAALLWLLGFAFAVGCTVVLDWRLPVLMRWVARQRDALVPAAAYGGGLGLFAVTLAARFGADGVAGALLLAALVLLSEVLLQVLLAGMRGALRRHGAGEAYAERVRRWLLGYAAFFALAPATLGAAGAVFPALPLTAAAAGLHFALLGATVALVSVCMALRQERPPAMWVLVAGGLAVIGVPAGLLMTAAYVVTLLWLLRLSNQVARHAVLFL